MKRLLEQIVTFFFAAVVVVLAVQSPAYGRVLYIDSNSAAATEDGTPIAPFKTITAAVAASLDKDVLLIYPGEYSVASGEIFPIMINHSLGLVGAGVRPDIVYDADTNGFDLFQLADSVNVDFVSFENLHFVGPWDERTFSSGWQSSIKEFTANNCLLEKGGSFGVLGTPDGRAIFSNNSQTGYYPDWWQFADVRGSGLAVAVNNVIDNSHAVIEGQNNNSLIVDSNKIANTTYGVAVWGGNDTVIIKNNIILDSLITGLLIRGASSLQIINNTIDSTQALHGVPNGGNGIDIGPSGTIESADIINNIISFGEAYGIRFTTLPDTLNISSNDVYGNALGNYDGIADPTGTSGNISVDPLLDGTGHLQGGSACVDAGADTSPYGVVTDFDGDFRSVPYDIGADESACTDNDNDGWTTCDGDCDDNDPDVNPGKNEKGPRKNDGKDNDCNGVIDG